MTVRTRNRLIVGGLALLLLVVVLLFTFVFVGEEEVPIEEPIEVVEPPPLGVSEDILAGAANPLEIQADEEEVDSGATAAAQVAELFTERFGSYSNQGNFQNLRDLLPVMTATYRAETESYLDSVASQLPPGGYIGYTSTKVSTDEIAYDADGGSAVFEIRVQETKIEGTAEPQITYPVYRVELEKVGEDWKVASAEKR